MINDADINLEHHKRREYCLNRLIYRQGRVLKAVKVYSVAIESRHLFVFGVPKINLKHEIKRSLQRYGVIESVQCITEELAQKMELELFTDVFHVKFEKIENARRAKRYMDANEFYGGILHLSYAPEKETQDELLQKLVKRRREVDFRIRKNAKTKIYER